MFYNKMTYLTKNFTHMTKNSLIRTLKMVIYEKIHDTWELPMVEPKYMVEKHNTLMTINYSALGFANQTVSTMTSIYARMTNF